MIGFWVEQHFRTALRLLCGGFKPLRWCDQFAGTTAGNGIRWTHIFATGFGIGCPTVNLNSEML